MADPTASDVKAIMDTDVSDSSLTNFFIPFAVDFVDDRFSGKGVSATIKDHIKLLLAAHYATMDDQRVQEERIGNREFEAKYTGQYGKGLEATRYGQAALQLDPSGTLANAGKRGASLEILAGVNDP